MRKYRLYDRYEDYGFIDGFDSVKALVDVAKEWIKETGGECELEVYEWNDIRKKYEFVKLEVEENE
jgi:hypothetical protein